MKKTLLSNIILLLVILPLVSNAQRNKRYPWEIGVDLGATNFLGDLGGANAIGTHFAKDLEISLTRPAAGIHLRYRKSQHVGFKADFAYGIVFGNDALTQERYRNNRNLNFKSNIFEFAGQIEFYISKERPGHIYHYKKLHGWKHLDIQEYFFVGVGGFYFNPKAFYVNKFYELRPFRTEGEGIAPGTKMYSNFSVCFPMGLGFKYALNRRWAVGLEYGLRLTMTDYIDDVSTNYYDPAQIAAAQTGFDQTLAVHFANPTTGAIDANNNWGIDPTAVGQQRGDPEHKDAYMFMCITVNYKVGKLKRTHSKF